jgi:transglutaminase/protease-like cytokinesis protein 3
MLSIHHSEEQSSIQIDTTVLKRFETDRSLIYSEIDIALSRMEDGSDAYILYQISEYLCQTITYTDGYRNVIDALDGKGVCGVYALLFKMMAERVGIPVDIITGYVENNKPGHAWNRTCIDGQYLYYDVTALDTDLVPNYINIQSEEELHKDHLQFIGVFYVHMIDVFGDC